MLNKNIEEALRWAFSKPPPEIIQQNEWELRTFLEKVTSELRPQLTLEIGTWNGANAAVLSLATQVKTVSCDIQDYEGKDVSMGVANRLGGNLTFLTQDARAKETVEKIKVMFDGNKLDLLFLDDGHEFETIELELGLYGPMVRSGGWIVFHDINFDANQCSPGNHAHHMRAPYHWSELKGNKEEIIFRGNPVGPGIGILRT